MAICITMEYVCIELHRLWILKEAIRTERWWLNSQLLYFCLSHVCCKQASRLLYKATEWCQNMLYVKTTNFDLSTVFTLSWIAYNVPNLDFIVLLRHTHCRKHTKTKPSSVLMVAGLVTQESSRLKSCRPKPESSHSILLVMLPGKSGNDKYNGL